MTYEDVLELAQKKIAARQHFEMVGARNIYGLTRTERAEQDVRFSVAQEEMWKSEREYENAVKLYNVERAALNDDSHQHEKVLV